LLLKLPSELLYLTDYWREEVNTETRRAFCPEKNNFTENFIFSLLNSSISMKLAGIINANADTSKTGKEFRTTHHYSAPMKRHCARQISVHVFTSVRCGSSNTDFNLRRRLNTELNIRH
jgi:hypothetical protein